MTKEIEYVAFLNNDDERTKFKTLVEYCDKDYATHFGFGFVMNMNNGAYVRHGNQHRDRLPHAGPAEGGGTSEGTRTDLKPKRQRKLAHQPRRTQMTKLSETQSLIPLS